MESPVSVRAIATALPPHVVRQEEVAEGARLLYAGREDLLRLVRIFPRSGVDQRHTAFPADYYMKARSFEERNRDYVEQGLILAERAAKTCLERAGLEPTEIDHIYLITTTGLATPSLDALLAPRLGLRRDVRRWPIFGLGCAGGAGAIVRAADVLRGAPEQNVLVVSVELCGQVFSHKATTPTDVVGAALFGDGAVAAVVGHGSGPRILATRTLQFDQSSHLMGWAFTDDGMRLVLSKEISYFVMDRLKPVVEQFLADASTPQDRIAHWILHPGGRSIIETYRDLFGLSEEMLKWTRESLARVGNLSSASVLFVLADVMASGCARPGDRGLLCALGPAFAAEMVLLEW